LTVPSPSPLPPDVIVNQDALGVADHMQPSCAATPIDRLPPVDGTLSVVGVTVKLQGTPSCSSTNNCEVA
jgi:hypothetical protein